MGWKTSTKQSTQAKHQAKQLLLLLLLQIDSIASSNICNIINYSLLQQTNTTTMPSNVFSNIAAHAKAHHDSLNAAYQATYSPGMSRSGTPVSSRNASTTSQESEHSERNITKAWKAIKKHHQDMNEAYAVFYSQGQSSAGSSRATSAAPTPKVSFEAERVKHEEEAQAPRNIEKVWKAIKNRAIEHHRSVNNATAALYGA
ncbi:hypothetical protein IQ06DRAFT_295760 [Phaeosphaeriaceae sp. SRC1lsM3a]|nr:hypothetical protein IQ06DRAFT_295760 [Stagonospora sp. SRC1lsM3a]